MAIKLQIRFLVPLAALFVTMGTLSATAQNDEVTISPTKVMYATKRSNVRAGPGTSYGKVGLLEVGEQVFVRGKSRNWLKLWVPSAGQQERFVYAPLLTSVRPESGTGATTTAASSGLTVKTITYGNGRYHGQTLNGKRHGRGVYTWTDGNRYEGEWRDGKRTGRGVFTWADGDRWEGKWRAGKKTGRGTFTLCGTGIATRGSGEAESPTIFINRSQRVWMWSG